MTEPRPPLAYVPLAPAPESALDELWRRTQPLRFAAELPAIVARLREARALWPEPGARAKPKRAPAVPKPRASRKRKQPAPANTV